MNCQDALQQKHTNLSTETTWKIPFFLPVVIGMRGLHI
jgi:hypothetical protein